MKQKFFYVLLTALFGMFGMNAWAQDYEIGNAQALIDFADAVNGGEFEANAVLTADIDMSELTDWTAIGDWGGVSGTASACYKGHFDGQGHKITGFDFTSCHNYYGIFGVISTGCLIENFSIYGTLDLGHKTGGVVGYSRDATPTIRNVHSYLTINVTEAETTAQRPGGILGSAVNGTTVIENCTYSGTLNVGEHTGNIGGIVGYVNNNTAAIVNITNCLFDGEILNGTTAEGQCGGIVGYNNKGIVTIKNCLSIGYIETKEGNDGMFFGRLNAGNSTFINNYYIGDNVNGTAGSGTAKGSAPVKVIEAQLTSGEVCYLLNESVSGGTNWFQTLVDDDYPFPYNGGVHDPIYMNGRQHCDGTAYAGATYSNDDLGMVTDSHDYTDGFCSYCGAFDANYMTPNADGIFEIGTPAQLKWFAVYVSQVSVAADAVLTADIDLSSVEWTTTIGTGSGNAAPGATAYTGTFDGQGHNIKNFNAEGAGHLGLFGDASGATIKNLSISGNLKLTEGYGGGVVAWPINSTIQNVHSALVISIPNSGTHHVGGIVGSARGGNTIKGCSFTGSVTVAAGSTDNFAGIAAYITNGDKVINCANYGNVTFSDTGCAAGGVVGYVNAQQAFVQNCLSTGTILFNGEGDPKYGAAILGRTKGYAADKVTNNYWLDGSAYGASKKDDGSDPLDTGSVTAAQLASGEVAYNLGLAWRQTLGTDATPVLDPTHDVVALITAAGYATLYVPDAEVTVPTGVTAFTGKINGEWLMLNPVEGVIPAKTAVVLKGAEGYYGFAVAAEEVIPDGALKINDDEEDGSKALAKAWAAPIEDNDLKGAAEDIDAVGKYVLANKDKEGNDLPIGFHKAVSGTIKAGKAYLEVPEGSSVKGFIFAFGDEDPTGINTIDNGQLTIDNEIYNLAGQRVQKMQKGINIVNGKKVMF